MSNWDLCTNLPISKGLCLHQAPSCRTTQMLGEWGAGMRGPPIACEEDLDPGSSPAALWCCWEQGDAVCLQLLHLTGCVHLGENR